MTAYIQGFRASDIEAMFAHSLNQAQLNYQFRARLSPLLGGSRTLETFWTNKLGEVEIDFLVDMGLVQPIFLDGLIAHFYAQWQRDKDQEKTNSVNEYGRMVGWKSAIRVPYINLSSQEESDETVRRIMMGGSL